MTHEFAKAMADLKRCEAVVARLKAEAAPAADIRDAEAVVRRQLERVERERQKAMVGYQKRIERR